MGKTLENQSTLRGFIDRFGMPRLIIAAFVVLLFVMAPIVGADLTMQIGNVINRFSWNAVLVLAMVPMIQSGCSLNFGIPLGILSGLLGGTLSSFVLEKEGSITNLPTEAQLLARYETIRRDD